MKKRILLAGLAAAGAVATFAALLAQRNDLRAAERVWEHLAGSARAGAPFDPSMVQGLPEPAQRYLLHAIAPGTPLSSVVELEMEGAFALGTKEDHRLLPMRARQILAPPRGFVWMPHLGSGLMTITGSDGYADNAAWTRFWLDYLVPVARSRASEDHVRSASARSVMEAIWVPASLLPANGAAWEAIDAERARVLLPVRGERMSMTITVDAQGRLTEVVMQRWSDANPEKTYRLQPFGGTMHASGTFGGYTIPTRVRVGNLYGEAGYFPFFDAAIRSARYL